MINIYVGNISWGTTEDDLRELFGAHGQVDRVKVITDRETGRSRGFAFVEMPDKTAGMNAIAALNETEFDGRNLRINEARPRD